MITPIFTTGLILMLLATLPTFTSQVATVDENDRMLNRKEAIANFNSTELSKAVTSQMRNTIR